MKNATDIKNWPTKFKPTDWPKNTLQHMSRDLFVHCLFPLRAVSGIPMWPSALPKAHVRESGTSQHSTNFYTQLSQATDMHVRTYSQLIEVMICADGIDAITGVGIYFNTNTPMFHIDKRTEPLMWLCYNDKDGKSVYLYRENDPIKFYKKLGELL